MSFDFRLRGLFALLAAMVLAIGVAACGDDDDDDSGDDTGGDETALIESNPDNEGIELPDFVGQFGIKRSPRTVYFAAAHNTWAQIG